MIASATKKRANMAVCHVGAICFGLFRAAKFTVVDAM
jgi:hypothetical protein